MAKPLLLPVHQLLTKWSRVGLNHDMDDIRSLQKLASVIVQFLEHQIIDFVHLAGDRPMLVSYMGDGTPIRTRHFESTPMQDRKSIKHSGKDCDEFYVQALIYAFYNGMGERLQKTLLRDPVPLTHGKDAWALLSMALDIIIHPRTCGHSGLVLFHCAFDRAIFSACSRLLNQYFTWQAPNVQANDAGLTPQMLFLLSWFSKRLALTTIATKHCNGRYTIYSVRPSL
jgi:hypothetical protein